MRFLKPLLVPLRVARQQPAATASARGQRVAAAPRRAQCGGPGGRDRADGGAATHAATDRHVVWAKKAKGFQRVQRLV